MNPIYFGLTSGSDQSITFSLACTSNGGPINTMQWEKDGVSVNDSNMYPDLTDAEMATYSNTLQVTGRETGMYTCTATDGATFSLSASLTVDGNVFNFLLSNKVTKIILCFLSPHLQLLILLLL